MIQSQTDKHTVLVCIAKIPSYLQAGEFYRSLDGNDQDEAISVPADTLKESPVICNDRDLVHLLQSLRFWMVVELPDEILQYVLFEHPETALTHIFQYEPEFPHLTTLRMLVEVDNIENNGDLSLLDRALQLGDMRTVRFLHEHGQEFSVHSTRCAASSGNLDCLKCAQGHQESVSEDAFKVCIIKGHLDCLAYLHSIDQRVQLHSTYACTIAAESRQLSCLKFLYEHGYSLHYTTANAAVANNDLEMLEYLHEHGYHCMFQGCARIAALKGYNECLLFMHEHGYPFNEDKCAWAAEGGQLQCLQFLREHGCPWDFRTCDVAIWRGHMDCLQYAHENGCFIGYADEMLEPNSTLSSEMREYVAQILREYDEIPQEEENAYLNLYNSHDS